MYLGYNTNGWTGHCFADCVAVLAELGYGGVAVTLDHHLLNPYAPDLSRRIAEAAGVLERYEFESVIETGARFLLDPRRKHQPTLLSESRADRERRVDFLVRAVDIGAALGSGVVSFWSGRADGPIDDAKLLARLTEGCKCVLDRADRHGIRLGFEPEPGMWVDTLSRFAELDERIGHELFGLTLDVGHVQCIENQPPGAMIRHWGGRAVNVHMEDMTRGVHEHLEFGEGEIDFGSVFGSLEEAGYPGGVFVELPRHAHDAVEVARRSMAFLEPFLKG